MLPKFIYAPTTEENHRGNKVDPETINQQDGQKIMRQGTFVLL